MTFVVIFTKKVVSQFVLLHLVAAVGTVVVLNMLCKLANMPTNCKLWDFKYVNIIAKVMNPGKGCSTVP